MPLAHAYVVVDTTDATRAPLGSTIVTDAKLGNGENEFVWTQVTEQHGRVSISPLCTCRYLGEVASTRATAA